MRIAHHIPISEANGPGRLTVFWVAGCTLACKGCINKHLWSPNVGQDKTPYEMLKMIDPAAQGICMTGGEPLQQNLVELFEFLGCCKKLGLMTVMFTGFTQEEIESAPLRRICANLVDVMICGRYDASKKCDEPLRASDNQVVVTSELYQLRVADTACAELEIDLDTGLIRETGVHR